ncbi:MAG: acetyl-CoA carboxylase biotin carboxyl carrier protein [Acidobacteriota bacterium]|jgi:acetyl-CoA carboxylase biotin carboxyl carrier protein|nr:acetyl-CoA carboxylase biotin carboxyl carrier protein [Acidobacteriota bacterium]
MASATSKEDNKEGYKEKSKVTDPSLNMSELRELADLIDKHGFTDFEFENKRIRVRLSKNLIVASGPQPAQTAQATTQGQQMPAQTAASDENTSNDTVDAISETDDGLHKITSPIVGTFYNSPAPDKPAYVKEGDQVSADTVVCIVEAMKLMNEIQAEVSGEIVKIYVENAQPVEFGQPLFGIK